MELVCNRPNTELEVYVPGDLSRTWPAFDGLKIVMEMEESRLISRRAAHLAGRLFRRLPAENAGESLKLTITEIVKGDEEDESVECPDRQRQSPPPLPLPPIACGSETNTVHNKNKQIILPSMQSIKSRDWLPKRRVRARDEVDLHVLFPTQNPAPNRPRPALKVSRTQSRIPTRTLQSPSTQLQTRNRTSKNHTFSHLATQPVRLHRRPASSQPPSPRV